jgi:mRNA interferase RelE/StbE
MWKIDIAPECQKLLKKLDCNTKKLILNYLDKKIGKCGNPKNYGKPLEGPFIGLWRYRVGKFRIVCKIQHSTCVIIVFAIGKRSEIYKQLVRIS